jgi:hypothetical protein
MENLDLNLAASQAKSSNACLDCHLDVLAAEDLIIRI